MFDRNVYMIHFDTTSKSSTKKYTYKKFTSKKSTSKKSSSSKVTMPDCDDYDSYDDFMDD